MYFVYIISNYTRTVFYTGVTNDLCRRIEQHYDSRGTDKSFAGKYWCHHLLYYEEFDDISTAINREKEIKAWGPQKKINLMKETNPSLSFLNADLLGYWTP